MDFRTARTIWAEWEPTLRRLDARLERAVSALVAAKAALAGDLPADSEPALASLPGLYLDPADILRLVRRPAGQFSEEADEAEHIEPEPLSNAFPPEARAAQLERGLRLTPFDVDVVVLAFAAEIDPKYEKVFSCLNDDVGRKRPTVGLALALLCGEPIARLARREAFRPGSPLRANGLIDLIGDDAAGGTSLLANAIRLEEGALRFLCGEDGWPSTLEGCLVPSAPQPPGDPASLATDDAAESIRQAVRSLKSRGEAVRLALAGDPGVGKTRRVEVLARALRSRPLSLDVSAWAELPRDASEALGRALAFQVRARHLVVHLVATRDPGLARTILGGDEADSGAIDSAESAHRTGARAPGLAAMLDALAHLPSAVPIVLETSLDADRAGAAARRKIDQPFLVVHVEAPPAPARRAAWAASLARADLPTEPASDLAEAFHLGPGPIESSVREAAVRGRGIDGVWSAARARAADGLEGLADRIEPRAGWHDLVLPDESRAQLEDLVRRVLRRERVMGEWGFGAKLGYGTGAGALFSGPPGTGKTLAAEVLAGRLGQLLYRVECSAVISKYIGETEKNLERIFVAARRCDAVLLFDEADALFAKRSDIQDARDRYANQETAYLLQRFERHDKLTILATNFPNNIDPAFPRRLTQVVHFSPPDVAGRKAIWDRIWPENLPRDPDLDTLALATRFPISGGHIKNAALGAAYRAADEPGSPPVATRHVLAAMADEYRKLGKSFETSDTPRRIAPVRGEVAR